MIKELLSKLIQQIDELAKPTKSNLFNSDKFPRKYQLNEYGRFGSLGLVYELGDWIAIFDDGVVTQIYKCVNVKEGKYDPDWGVQYGDFEFDHIGSDFMSTITIDKITRRVIRDKLSEEQRQKRILKAEQKRYDLDSIFTSRAYRD